MDATNPNGLIVTDPAFASASGISTEVVHNFKDFFEDPEILADALRDPAVHPSSAAYAAGYTYLRFLAKVAADADIFVGTDENKNQSIDFNSTDLVITNYEETNTINYNNPNFSIAQISSTFNDFMVIAGNDNTTLMVRDVRGKTISLTSTYGDVYAYMADESGEIDGKNFGDGSKYEILFGENNVDNVIRAGSGGSMLWGGVLGNDELIGGAGVDKFIYSLSGGNDKITDAQSQDEILLRDMTLEQISSAQFTDGGVNLSFTYGGSLEISGRPEKFVVESSNVTYTADYENKTWK